MLYAGAVGGVDHPVAAPLLHDAISEQAAESSFAEALEQGLAFTADKPKHEKRDEEAHGQPCILAAWQQMGSYFAFWMAVPGVPILTILQFNMEKRIAKLETSVELHGETT